jgi:hypothetical protein
VCMIFIVHTISRIQMQLNMTSPAAYHSPLRASNGTGASRHQPKTFNVPKLKMNAPGT